MDQLVWTILFLQRRKNVDQSGDQLMDTFSSQVLKPSPHFEQTFTQGNVLVTEPWHGRLVRKADNLHTIKCEYSHWSNVNELVL